MGILFLIGCGGGSTPQLIRVTGPSSLALGDSGSVEGDVVFTDQRVHPVAAEALRFSSSDQTVATIDPHGRVLAKAIGQVVIKVTYSGASGTLNLAVTQAELRSLAIDPAGSLTLAQGLSQQLKLTGKYSDGSTADLTGQADWSSSMSNQVSVNKGLITGHSVGDQIRIDASDGTLDASLVVSVSAAAVATLELDPSSSTLAQGTTENLTVTAILSDGSREDVTASSHFSVQDQRVAQVTNPTAAQAGGVITAGQPGTTQITAELDAQGQHFSASAALTVTTPSLASLTITPDAETLPAGTSQNFTVIGKFTDGTQQDVTAQAHFTSSDSTVATVSDAGALRALRAGTTRVTASVGTLSVGTNVTATAASLTSLAISMIPQNGQVARGTDALFSLVGTFSDGSTHDLTDSATWTSNGGAVSSQGVLHGGLQGDFVVTASIQGQTASKTFSVTDAVVASIQIDPGPAGPSVGLGAKRNFRAVGTFSDGTTEDVTALATWSSSAPTIVAASNGAGTLGQITGLARGGATVTAAFGGKTGTLTLTVGDPDLLGLAFTGATSLAKGTLLQLAVTGTFSDGSSRDVTALVGFMSQDPGVATVTAQGQASGVSLGTASITASKITAAGKVVANETISVTAPVPVSCTLSPAADSVPAGQPTQFTVTTTLSDHTTTPITTPGTVWALSNTAIAQISTGGTVTSTTLQGTTDVTATLAGGVTCSTTLTLTMPLTKAVLPSGPGVVNFTCMCGVKPATTRNGTFLQQVSCGGLTSPAQCAQAALTGVGCTNAPIEAGGANNCTALCALEAAAAGGGGAEPPRTPTATIVTCF
jgi:hypothetical protein